MCAAPCSELNIPWGGIFTIYSPAAAQNRTLCLHSCMQVHAKDIPGRKLTSLVMQGGLSAFAIWALSALP